MKNKIKKWLDSYLGIQIIKTPGRAIGKVDFDKESLPVFIDFIGPSGVGKTTLYNEVYKQRRHPMDWLSPKEFIHAQGNIMLDGNIPSDYEEIVRMKIENVCRNEIYKPIQMLNQFSFLQKVMKEEIIIKTFNSNQKVIYEDGFFHVFGEEIKLLLEKDSERYESFIQNRALILCVSTPEKIASQIIKREKVEGRRAQHINKDLETLIQQEDKTLEMRKNLAHFFGAQGVPILVVDTSNPLNENGKEITSFIKGL